MKKTDADYYNEAEEPRTEAEAEEELRLALELSAQDWEAKGELPPTSWPWNGGVIHLRGLGRGWHAEEGHVSHAVVDAKTGHMVAVGFTKEGDAKRHAAFYTKETGRPAYTHVETAPVEDLLGRTSDDQVDVAIAQLEQQARAPAGEVVHREVRPLGSGPPPDDESASARHFREYAVTVDGPERVADLLVSELKAFPAVLLSKTANPSSDKLPKVTLVTHGVIVDTTGAPHAAASGTFDPDHDQPEIFLRAEWGDDYTRETLRHELGHAWDYRLKKLDLGGSRQPAFREAFNADLLDMRKRYESMKSESGAVLAPAFMDKMWRENTHYRSSYGEAFAQAVAFMTGPTRRTTFSLHFPKAIANVRRQLERAHVTLPDIHK